MCYSALDDRHREFGTYLLFLDDVDASLDVGKGVHGGKNCLPLVLLVEFTPWPPALGEGRGVHEAPQVEVLLKVRQSVFHLIVVKVGLHVSDLDVCLERSPGLFFYSETSVLYFNTFKCVYFS